MADAEQVQAWQTILLLLIEYTAFVLGTGAFVFRKKLRGKGFIYGVLVSLVMGNILCMNLVFVAFALRCYRRWGILFLWMFLILWSWIWPIRKKVPAKIEQIIESIQKMVNGEYGFHMARKNFMSRIRKMLKKRIGIFLKTYFFPHFIEIVFVLGIMLFNLWYHSYQGIYFGGMGVSDVGVHTEWIQKMREGNIFGNGIYPFGFHNIIYLMLTVFQNKLIPVMVFFATVQDFWIFLLLYFLMRKVFRFSGTAIMGFFIFSVMGIIGNYRYQFTLPQEYGMLGLYPAVLFLWMYLEQKKTEIKIQKIKPEHGESREARKLVRRLNRKVRLRDRENGVNELAWYFGFSVALTFMSHFYITIACFFLCVGLVLVYPITLFRNKCFWPLVASVLLCMSMALAPMVGWYVAGKPLEGSLNWAIGVIAGTNEEDDDLTNQIDKIQYGSMFDSTSDSEESTENGLPEGEPSEENAESSTMTEEEEFWHETAKKPIPQKIYRVLKRICLELMEPSKGKFFFYSLPMAILYSCALLFFKRRREQGKLLLGLSIYTFMLLILARASWFQLPNLIEPVRVAIFVDYVAAVFFASPLEVVTGWFFSIKRFNFMVSLGIYAFDVLLVFQTVAGNQVRNLSAYNTLQYKPALDLAGQIMDEYNDFSWTIVSPVDELSFIRRNGYHYEWLEFLAKQAKYKEKETLYIPTKYVFFYVEKRPLQYGGAVWMSNGKPEYEKVSEEEANIIFNEGESFNSLLYSTHRQIIESKVYYWAKTYASYFPREMTVYYEDDDFICYRLVQDPYSLNNLVIDFGYNVGKQRNEAGQ